MKRETVRVYPVLDLGCFGAQTPSLVAAALRGGATCIQLRDKSPGGGAITEVWQRVRPWVEEAGAPVVVNDRVELALALGAEGVHIGQGDMPVTEARALAEMRGQPQLIIGVSVTTVEQAKAALAGGATYLSISPVFHTPTKVDTDPAAGLEGVRAVRAACPDTPLVAIGGIKHERVAEVLAAGADGVAFISAMGARPEESVRAMAAAVEAALGESP